MIMEKIFNLPCVGDLFLEHAFYMLDDEPILFVCKGTGGIRYLCSCCRLYEKWVIGQVTETELIALIDDRVSIRDVFENCDTKFLIRWDGEKFELDGDVHDNLLPKTGALLELDREKCGAYRRNLVKDRRQWQSIQVAIQESSKVLSAWKQDQEVYESLLKEWKSLGPVIDEVSRTISSAVPIGTVTRLIEHNVGTNTEKSVDFRSEKYRLFYNSSIQLTYQNADCWEKLAQYIQSASTVAETEDKEEQVQKQALSVKQTTETYGSVHNEAPCNDAIQYLAA